MWKEFQPAFRFLFIFLALYFAGNIGYGLWITYYKNLPDPATRAVTIQTSATLKRLGFPVTPIGNDQGPTVFLMSGGKVVLNIYEGCNGINVMIVFVAFLIAFGGPLKKLSWYLPLGLVIIHMANIARLISLYYVAIKYQRYFYYIHKYIFTAAIYFIVLLLWLVWVAKINGKSSATSGV